MKWKISSKIMVAIMTSSAALAAIIGSIALFQATHVIERSALNNLQATAESYSREFSITTEKVESVLDSYIASIRSSVDIESINSEKEEYISVFQDKSLLPLTKEYAETTEGILGIYFDVDPYLTPNLLNEESVYGAWYLDKHLTGKIVREPLEKKKNFYPENNELQWYYKPIRSQKGVWSKPYRDIYTGHYMISYNKPVYVDNQLIGVAGIDIVFEDIITMIESVKVYDTGYAFLLDEDFDFIVHPEISSESKYMNLVDFENSQYKKLVDEMKQKKSGIVEINQGYNKKLAGFSHLNNGYIVVLEVKSFEILEGLNKVRSIIDAIILFGILVSAVAAYLLGKFISKPVERAGKIIERMMHFDYSSEIDDSKLVNISSDSGKMIVELSKVRESINHSIMMLRDNSNNIYISSEKIEKHFQKLNGLLERLEIMNELKKNSNEKMDEGREILSEIGCCLEEIKRLNHKNSKITELFKTD